jgi:K+-sensing histidine kinase KdpD
MQESLAKRGINVANMMMQFDEPLDPRDIARDILKTARERDYGTVVVGRHAFSGLKRLFHHHVGEELVRAGQGIAIWVVG